VSGGDALVQIGLGLTLLGAYVLFVLWARREWLHAEPSNRPEQWRFPPPQEEAAPQEPPPKRRCRRRRVRNRPRRAIVVVT